MARFSFLGSSSVNRIAEADSVAVIGLGRFGSALALELMETGVEVLGIDGNEEVVQNHNGLLTHVVRADSTKEETLRQLSVPDFDRVVVAIGSDIQANILTSSLLLRLGIPHVWAKAVTDPHGIILEQLGVHHIVYPEKDMGRRVAHLVRGAMDDYLELGDDFALVKTTAPASLLGRPIGESKIRKEHGVTVTAFHRPGKGWTAISLDTVLQQDDVILIAGVPSRVEAYSQLR